MSPQRTFPRIRGHMLFALASGILLYMSLEQYRAAHADAATTLQRLETCRRQSAEIKDMRERPAFAATAIEDVSALTGRIARARRAAQIAEQSVDLVDPRSLVRLEDSSYLLRPVSIDLRGLRLPQVVQFAAALSDLDAGMWVNQLRLSPVRRDSEEAEPELWNVELTLTQIVFSPTSE